MSKITVFNFTSLNGFYKGTNKDINWHQHGEEENAFSANMLSLNNTLLFGRVTYEMMESYWPTPYAIENDPEVATAMNKARKIVISSTLQKAAWNNTNIIKGDLIKEMKKMKSSQENDITILGSGSIVTQLTENKLIDEYQIMIDPVMLDAGTSLCTGIKKSFELKLTGTKIFKSGVVLLTYIPK